MPFLIISDRPVLRGALQRTIESHFPSSPVWAARTSTDALLILQIHPVDVVILDIAFPYHRGLNRLRRIKRLNASVICLVISLYREPHYVRRALANGASGYLVMPASSAELCRGLRTVLSSHQIGEGLRIDRAARQSVAGSKRWKYESLSLRGRKVLAMSANGCTVSDIAKRLNLSVRTVNVYRTRLLTKLDLRTTEDLIRYTMRYKSKR